MEQPEILIVAFSLAGLTYYLAGLMMTLPKEDWVRWGHLMRNDSIIAMIGIGSVSAIQLLLGFVQNFVFESAGDGLYDPDIAFGSIMFQLVSLDGALVMFYSLSSGIPFLEGFAQVLEYPILVVTGAIIIWTTLHILSQFIPIIFLTLFSSGLALWSVPFRIGRSAGSSLMALSMVLLVGLPLAAPIALWLESEIVNDNEVNEIKNSANSLSGMERDEEGSIGNENFVVGLFTGIAEKMARIIGGFIIALVIFPAMYLGLLGLFARSIASLIGGGGSASGVISLRRLGLNG